MLALSYRPRRADGASAIGRKADVPAKLRDVFRGGGRTQGQKVSSAAAEGRLS